MTTSDDVKQCLIDDPWKLIFHLPSNVYSLYHLGLDPRESNNVIDDFPETWSRLRRYLSAWRHWRGSEITHR